MDNFSYIANAEPAYIESLYQDFKKDPVSIDQEWKKFFEGFEFALANYESNGGGAVSPKEFKVLNLINAYRAKAHLIADTNPIRPRRDRRANLELVKLGLDESDLPKTFQVGSEIGLPNATLQQILDKLKKVYTEGIGVELDYVTNLEQREWLLEKMEQQSENIKLPIETKRRILEKLNQTVVFEQFLDKKYIGQKRFSLEGGETTIPALDAIVNLAAEHGVEEVVIGMAHRGRLNVLANLMGKTYEEIFNEFEGEIPKDMTMGDGDVKYHLGYSSNVKTHAGKTVNLKLAPNPSHLEAVAPVVQGFVRGKANLMYESNLSRILPIIIHGDAAVAGQGIAYEVVQMSELKGYHTGGSIHFVINNQIGFTTDFDDARSSNYCTSVARIIKAPVLHVNGDRPEDVIFAVELATEFRQKFRRDVFVDMVCYRKHGHNEGDDPQYTQPELYKLIKKHRNPREIYTDYLVSKSELDRDLAQNMQKEFWGELQKRLDEVKQKPLTYKYQEPEVQWSKLNRLARHVDFETNPKTNVNKATLRKLFKALMSVPKDFTVLRKMNKMLGNYQQMFEKGELDWAAAELLAYASLLDEGNHIRMSGQDCKRGTFSHRHAVLYDTETNEEYNRLNNVSAKQGKFRIYNSLLSEFGVLGFEFGYSMVSPQTLTIWEAQFGDFANGAQTIIDQFITSAWSKWQRMSGLVLLLPHGYEGQGPEHSSARLERFLQSCAEFNMIVANVTTPANFFHLIRRQLKFDFRKPLIVMSPKSLLRHPLCRSSIDEFSKGGFRNLIRDDYAHKSPAKVRRLLFCSGKIYYDLLDAQQKGKHKDVAIIRLEQLYPLPMTEMEEIFDEYKGSELCWVQEEPANMGAWHFILSRFRQMDWEPITRKSSASPATGFMKVHLKEQQDIIERAFA